MQAVTLVPGMPLDSVHAGGCSLLGGLCLPGGYETAVQLWRLTLDSVLDARVLFH